MSQKLALVFPDIPQRQRLVALPLCLLMAWKLYPLDFCADTKTIASITNTISRLRPRNKRSISWIKGQTIYQWNREVQHRSACMVKPQAKAEIFIDDCILIAQGGEKGLWGLSSILFTVIDEVFWANDKKDTNTSHKEPISLKKARPEWLYLGFLEVSAGLDHWHDQDNLRAPRTSHHTPKINTRLNPAITKRTPAKNGTKYCDLWLLCFLELEDCSVKCNWHFVQT